MKNLAKLLGIIALAAVIMFAATACENPVGGGGGPGAIPTPSPSPPTTPSTPTSKGTVPANDDTENDTIIDSIAVTGVKLNTTGLILAVGGEPTLIATVSPAAATNKNVTWSSSDAAIASVANGVITAVADGIAYITVTTADGGKTASCAVSVYTTPPPDYEAVTGVSLDQDSLTLSPGAAQTLSATLIPDNATFQDILWSSSDTDVATVDENGVITAIAGGTTTITVTTGDGGQTASCAVTVTGQTGAVYTYYWVNEQGQLVFTNGAETSIARGNDLTITVQGSGYSDQRWYINGTEDTAAAGYVNYVFKSLGKPAGRHTIGLRVAKNGVYYYAESAVLVTEMY